VISGNHISAAHHAIKELQEGEAHLNQILSQLEPRTGRRDPGPQHIPAPVAVREWCLGGTSYPDFDVILAIRRPTRRRRDTYAPRR
jgi:hypothetical protein